MSLVGFNSNTTLGSIKLLVMENRSMMMTNFVVVNASTHYYLILGRPWIHKMRAVPLPIIKSLSTLLKINYRGLRRLGKAHIV